MDMAVAVCVKILDTWDEQYSPIFGGLMKNTFCFL